MTSGSFNLPGGVEDILSERALELENLRRSLIDCYSQKGFSLVYPSIIEFADAIGGEVNSELKKRAYTFSDDSSSVVLKDNTSEDILVKTEKAKGKKCPVCWKISIKPCERHGV